MNDKKTAIALGYFDGVHLAHQKIISRAVELANAGGMRPIALSFDSPPSLLLRGEAPLSLTERGEKERLIGELGAECVLLPVTRELLQMSGRDFAAKVLVNKFHAVAAVCGYNYHFGRDRLTAGDLASLGRELGFEAAVMPEERLGGQSVSSSRIRELLLNGRPEEAALMLGRPYSTAGEVRHGKSLGRTMGFPTVNLYPGPLPLERGVYATRVIFDGAEYAGVTNVGVNPTVHDGGTRVETHILDFTGNLYGKYVTVKFLHFIRPERVFPSVDELFAQIRRDAERVRELSGNKMGP